METRYLKTLVVAAETGNFSRTAEILNLTQSAVSQRIKFLEDHFDQQLFDRSATGLILTQIGARIVDKARAILTREQELFAELERFAVGKRLSLCCTPTFGTAFLPQVLNRFLLQNADLNDLKFIFAQPDQAIKGLMEGDFDLAIIEHCQDLELEKLFIQPLPEDELVFIAAPQLGLGAAQVQLSSLQRHRLYVRREGCSSKRLLQQNLEEVGSSLDSFHSLIISDDLRLTIDNVQSGNGVSFISRSLVVDQLATGTLNAYQIPRFRQVRCRSVVLQQHRSEEALLKTFLACIESVCGPGSCRLNLNPLPARVG
jgi:DNA-binding transcriptional LysR family regulator